MNNLGRGPLDKTVPNVKGLGLTVSHMKTFTVFSPYKSMIDK